MTDRKKYTAADWAGPLAFLVIFFIGLGVLAACQSAKEPELPPQTKIQAAASACGISPVRVVDQGKTLMLDTQGREDMSGDSTAVVGCILNVLGAPQSVAAHMDQTRALDGMQTAEWGGINARWTFHPSAGMTLVLTE